MSENTPAEKAVVARKKAIETAAFKGKKEISFGDSNFAARVIEGLQKLRGQGYSEAQLGKLAGVSQPTVGRILALKQEPRISTIGALMDMIGAKIMFPWDKANETNRVRELLGRDDILRIVKELTHTISSSLQDVKDETILEGFSKIRYFNISSGKALFDEKNYLPLSNHHLSTDVNVDDFGAYTILENIDVVVDMTCDYESEKTYLVLTSSLQALPAKVFINQQKDMPTTLQCIFESACHKPLVLVQHKDFKDIADIIIGKIVLTINKIE